MRILVVRLSSLGDIVHTIPAVAGLRRTFPAARIDWLVDDRYAELVDLVAAVDRRVGVPRTGVLARLPSLVRALRETRYDVALDFQGLLKSALLARSAGARSLIGFDRTEVRERPACWLYTATPRLGDSGHVIERNLALVAGLGVRAQTVEFPIAEGPSARVDRARAALGAQGSRPFALLNPGAAWASKRWAPARFGALAQRLRNNHGLPSVVLWGPGERALAARVVAAGGGAAAPAPATTVGDLVALARSAAVVVAGDTGPLHVATAVGTPTVGIYGPSDPRRNGPWSPRDIVVTPRRPCRCRLERSGSSGVVVRRCAQQHPCLASIPVEHVTGAVARRLAAEAAHDA